MDGRPPTTDEFGPPDVVRFSDTTPELSEVNDEDDMRGLDGRGRLRNPSPEHNRAISSYRGRWIFRCFFASGIYHVSHGLHDAHRCHTRVLFN